MADADARRNEQAVEALFKALAGKNPDYDAAGALLAEDCAYWALTPVSPLVHGRDAIIADLKRQFAFAGDLESAPPHALVASGRHVVLERTDFVTVAGSDHRAGIRICSVFEVDEAGKIAAWREYFDKAFCERQLGITGSNYSATPASAS
jgi:limonene-1,2-epoxide hydrolase